MKLNLNSAPAPHFHGQSIGTNLAWALSAVTVHSSRISTVNVSEKQKMDAFDDGFGGEGEVEVDPAAEFLAKEQEELGDIGEFPEDCS